MIARTLAALVAVLLVVPWALAQPLPGHQLSAGETLGGRFVQVRHVAGLSASLSSEGTFLLAAGKGLVWRTEQPFDTAVVMTPAVIVQLAEGREVQRILVARLPFLARFYTMLSGALAGDWGAMAREFSIDRQGGEGDWTIVLKPLDAGDPAATQLQSITAHGGRFLDSVEIHRANGDWDHIDFSGQAISSAPLTPDTVRLFGLATP